MEVFVRLDKYLAEMSYGTRNEVKKIIRSGTVTINGVQAAKPETKVNELSDIVYIGDERVSYSQYVYYMLNKPAGCVSATKDNVHKTVIDLLKKNIGNNIRDDIFPAGRLDIDTEGLVLLTNDGALAHMLLSPRRHVEKAYYLVADGIITDNGIKQLTEGIDIGDETLTLPAKAENIKVCSIEELGKDIQDIIKSQYNEEPSQTHEGKVYTSMELVLHEGRYHQVKRMAEAAGSRVLYLKRIRMGTLWLDKALLPGECRELSAEEVQQLRRTSG
ncbi:MAG: rRNA pseudouridine synthase [Lachnospiraceae bacterium]